MKIKKFSTTFHESPHVSTPIHTRLLMTLSIPQRNKRKENILRYPLNKRNTQQKTSFHSRSLHAFHSHIRTSMKHHSQLLCFHKQKKLACRAAFPTEFPYTALKCELASHVFRNSNRVVPASVAFQVKL